jgi:hypothetical protein
MQQVFPQSIQPCVGGLTGFYAQLKVVLPFRPGFDPKEQDAPAEFLFDNVGDVPDVDVPAGGDAAVHDVFGNWSLHF